MGLYDMAVKDWWKEPLGAVGSLIKVAGTPLLLGLLGIYAYSEWQCFQGAGVPTLLAGIGLCVLAFLCWALQLQIYASFTATCRKEWTAASDDLSRAAEGNQDLGVADRLRVVRRHMDQLKHHLDRL